jgi:hypothetical protein
MKQKETGPGKEGGDGRGGQEREVASQPSQTLGERKKEPYKARVLSSSSSPRPLQRKRTESKKEERLDGLSH